MHTAKLNLCVFNNSIKRVKGAALFTVNKNIYVSNGQLTFYGLRCRQHSYQSWVIIGVGLGLDSIMEISGT